MSVCGMRSWFLRRWGVWPRFCDRERLGNGSFRGEQRAGRPGAGELSLAQSGAKRCQLTLELAMIDSVTRGAGFFSDPNGGGEEPNRETRLIPRHDADPLQTGSNPGQI